MTFPWLLAVLGSVFSLTPGQLAGEQVCVGNRGSSTREVNSLSYGLFHLWLSCAIFSHDLIPPCIAREGSSLDQELTYRRNSFFDVRAAVSSTALHFPPFIGMRFSKA